MKKFLTLLFITSIFASCKKVLFVEEPDTSPKSIFDQTWKFAQEKYSFFEYKNIDWDSVYTAFEPKVTNNLEQDSLFRLLGDMLYILRDGHVNLASGFDFSRNWEWYLNYPVNYDENLLERAYFKNKQQFYGPFTLFDFGDVGYIHYASFSTSVSEEVMKSLLTKFKDKKGLIIDLRDNGGGAVANVYTIGSVFVDESTVGAYERVKNGIGPTDFTPLKPMILEPIEDWNAWTKPVVLLTNRKCYSATNMFATLMSALPNVTLVGDQTGGGGGVPAYTQLTNKWIVRVSASQTFTLEGLNNEGGIVPDVKVDMDSADIANNEDSILEKALEIIR